MCKYNAQRARAADARRGGANPVTVRHALAELEADGSVRFRQYVKRAAPAQPVPAPAMTDLGQLTGMAFFKNGAFVFHEDANTHALAVAPSPANDLPETAFWADDEDEEEDVYVFVFEPSGTGGHRASVQELDFDDERMDVRDLHDGTLTLKGVDALAAMTAGTAFFSGSASVPYRAPDPCMAFYAGQAARHAVDTAVTELGYGLVDWRFFSHDKKRHG